MKKSPIAKPLLSVVIVSFNTKDILFNCLKSLEKVKDELPFEVIVSDNGSVDGSSEMVKDKFGWVVLVENRANLGFAKGNNKAKNIARGKYILFLNSDTVVPRLTLKKSVEYIQADNDIGSMTCKILLPNGELDRDTRRRFPTPMVSLKRLFLFSPKDYWYLDKSEDKIHEVDVIQGAFHLTRKKILDKVGWFDEDYFLDGEDIDLCWKIKQLGHKIMYYPIVSIVHVKKASKKKHSKLSVTSGMRAMEIFYKKYLWEKYPFYINYLVIFGIKLLLFVRLVKFYLR